MCWRIVEAIPALLGPQCLNISNVWLNFILSLMIRKVRMKFSVTLLFRKVKLNVQLKSDLL